jgi:di/tricarboxylate transporter
MSIFDLTGFKPVKAALTLIPPLLLFLINPFSMPIRPGFVLSVLFLVILWWINGAVPRSIACLVLLAAFLASGGSPPKQIFSFAFSPNFYIIILSFLFSRGVVNANITARIAGVFLGRFCNTPIRMVFLSFLLNTVFIFIIPQPFPRVIILSALYTSFLDRLTVKENTRRILLLSIYVSSPVTGMMFLNGDVVVNYSLLAFGGLQISPFEWIRAMTLPALVSSVLSFLVFVLVFRKDLKKNCFSLPSGGFKTEKSSMGKKEKYAFIIAAAAAVLWIGESLHGINGVWIMLSGTTALFIIRALEPGDLKVINFDLMLFLLTAFSIGGVMQNSGISGILFAGLSTLMPPSWSIIYLPALILIVIALHMVVGSVITTLSITVSNMLVITSGALPASAAAFICLIAVYTHYMLPFHHVTLMVGSGAKLYRDRDVARYGAAALCYVAPSILFVFIPWWRFVGIL